MSFSDRRTVALWRAVFSALVLLVAGAGTPALALGGSAASSNTWGLSSNVVMVLGSRGTVCTGTLLSQRIIVTAAHCTVGSKQMAVAYIEGDRPILQPVATVARHPGFSKNAAVSVDMALIRLQEPLPARYLPVGLDGGSGAAAIGESLTIAGFGLAEEKDYKSAGTLRAASVELLPRMYPRFLRLGIDGDASRLAICQGDSGGPVLAGGGAPSLVGVLYAHERNGKKASACGSIAQAVRVAPQRAWIDRVMAGW